MVDGPVLSSIRTSWVSGSRCPDAVVIEDLFQGLRVLAVRHRQPDHQREASPRLDDLADSDAANGLDRIEHLLCGHAVAGQGLVIDADS